MAARKKAPATPRLPHHDLLVALNEARLALQAAQVEAGRLDTAAKTANGLSFNATQALKAAQQAYDDAASRFAEARDDG